MAFNGPFIAQTADGTALDGVTAVGNYKTQAYDVFNADVASFSAVLAGMTGTISCTLALQFSNDVPPSDGLVLGQDWQPAESSWVAATSGGSPVSTTITTNTATMISLNDQTLVGRYLRAVWTYGTGVGGTLQVTGFNKQY